MNVAECQTLAISDLINRKVIAIGDGYRAKNSELSTEGIPFARVANINDGFKFEKADYFPINDLYKVGEKISRPNDVVFTSKGTVGRFAFVQQGTPQFVYSPQLCFWRVLNQEIIEPRFLYYWMQSVEFQAQANSVKGQTDMADYVSLFDQRRMKITLPPLPTQRRIADILSALDDKIELNRQTNATLEAMAQTIFKEWFVDFNYPGATGEVVDSELGLIPAGWRVGKLEEIATIVMGLSPSGDSYNLNGEGIPLINGPVEFGDYFPVKTKWTTEPTRMAESGDLIFCVRGSTTGRRVIADDSYCIGRGVCAIRAKNNARVFLYQTINSGIEDLLTKTTGSVFPSLSAPDIKNFSIVVPPWSIIEEFQELTNPFISKIETNINQMAALSLLRDSLLPKLMSGKIEVQTFIWEN